MFRILARDVSDVCFCTGLMECIPDTCSVDVLKKKHGVDSIATVFDILFADNPFEARKVRPFVACYGFLCLTTLRRFLATDSFLINVWCLNRSFAHICSRKYCLTCCFLPVYRPLRFCIRCYCTFTKTSTAHNWVRTIECDGSDGAWLLKGAVICFFNVSPSGVY